MSGGGGGGTTTTQGPSWQVPYLQRGLSEAGNVYNQDANGQNVAPISSQTQQSWDMATQRATNGSPLTQAAQDTAVKTINGGFLGSNPYLDQTFNRAALQTQNQLASEFAGAGRNVDASQGLRAQQLNDLATGIYGGAYDSERNRQQDAIGMANGLANQDYVDIGQLGQVGAAREGYNQEQLDAPGIALDRYLGRVSGNMGQTSYASQSRNRAAGAVGGGMLGYQLGNQYGGQYGGLAGGLLGSYLGGWG